MSTRPPSIHPGRHPFGLRARLSHGAKPHVAQRSTWQPVAVAVALGASAGCGGETATTETTASGTTVIPAGERCDAPSDDLLSLRAYPRVLVLAPGQTRETHVVVEPDVCRPTTVELASSDPTVAPAPPNETLGYLTASFDLAISGGEPGTADVTLSIPKASGEAATASVRVVVRTPASLTCSPDDDVSPSLLSGGATVAAGGSLAGASVSLAEGADAPNAGGFGWSVAPFEVGIGCAEDIVPAGYLALGPAVRFDPVTKRLPRELPLGVPIAPELLPTAAHLRHVRVAYRGAGAPASRTIAVADARLVEHDTGWALAFASPRLGTYQAVVAVDAGQGRYARRLTHRALVGLGMGAAGAAQLGLRHHQLFDTVAALGGPVAWSWLANHAEHNELGGFRPIAPGTTVDDVVLERTACTSQEQCAPDETCVGALETPATEGRCALLPPTTEPYVHPSSFDTWWTEVPDESQGQLGGRTAMVQLLRDLALAYGNPTGFNPLPGAEHLPAGVDPSDPSQTGGRDDDSCRVWVDPLAGPDEAAQQATAESCPAERCQHVLTLEGYYDDEYNPDGSFPVITFCDGSQSPDAPTPYAATWSAEGNSQPFEVALAVDYDGDGQRDELEPVIRAGHEPWYDWGSDGVPNDAEPGFGPDTPDPAGDDYDPQLNPTGTEGDHLRQPGEPFDDTGLDGVLGTADSPFDHGEADGELTLAPGLARLSAFDPWALVRGSAPTATGDPLADAAQRRIELWADGGLRDPFNAAEASRQLVGAFAARGRAVDYLTGFAGMPGLDSAGQEPWTARHVAWDELSGVALLRYGSTEPDAETLASGSGQHLGTPEELGRRMQSAMFFVGSRWPDAARTRALDSAEDPAEGAAPCELEGRCSLDFTSSFGRTGPITVLLPPGYAHADRTAERYPVVYLVHDWQSTPDSLLDSLAGLGEWMNDGAASRATRLPKMIVVLVDGRCRVQDGRPECFRGSFFVDSPRAGGAQLEAWWLELVDYVDQRFRTLGEAVVDVPD